jgi:Fe(3+) dicitrate transport protein
VVRRPLEHQVLEEVGEAPVRPGRSFFDPTWYHTLTATIGTWWSSWTMTSSPLSSVRFAILHAQTRHASVTGEVLDQTGALVPTAVVTLWHESLGTERRTTTRNGVYRLDDLVPGDYVATAASPGFAVAAQRVSLSGGATHQVQFMLRVGDLTEDVVVLASEVGGSHETLRRLPGSVDIVDRATLERSRVMTTNEALRKVAGVHVRDEEGFGLRPNIGLRGINPTRSNKVLLLEDGIPLAYAPYGDNASYYHPPIDRFERIEVMKGGRRSRTVLRPWGASSTTSHQLRRPCRRGPSA